MDVDGLYVGVRIDRVATSGNDDRDIAWFTEESGAGHDPWACAVQGNPHVVGVGDNATRVDGAEVDVTGSVQVDVPNVEPASGDEVAGITNRDVQPSGNGHV